MSGNKEPTEGIRHRQQNTVVYVNDNNLGKGTLYIAESQLSWIGEAGNGFSIEYPHISLHAISRDLSAFPQECLFLMLDTSLGDEDHNNGEEEDDDGHDSSRQETTELRLVPDDRGMLDAMFHAMNACQALHPDPEDSFSEEDFFEDADDDVPMEETDSQMAQLRIGSMAGTGHTAGRPVLGMAVGRAVGRAGGTLEGSTAHTLGVDTLGGMVAELDRHRDSLGHNTASGILGEGNMASDTLGGRVGGRVGDSMASGTLEGRVGGRVGGNTALGMVGGDSTVSGREIRIPQGGRSFSSDSMSHPDSSVWHPAAHSPQMALDSSHFDDAEN